jgi:hypothetical protein
MRFLYSSLKGQQLSADAELRTKNLHGMNQQGTDGSFLAKEFPNL